jgi:hypothetical protein
MIFTACTLVVLEPRIQRCHDAAYRNQRMAATDRYDEEINISRS